MAGRLRAISNPPRITPAIRLLHGDPSRAWRLTELAGACATSRTVFVAYLKYIASVVPLTYLTQ
ncbi:hypothetical protein [Pseudomonas sp. BIC9C]|uniref:hypothetical protein n=1 Tax=Pseudomonas sp. BIC9C TaxID=3078458 RepID=UPI002AD36C7C|nr:hypothetical protein [Pseudomonas sp. BIC9C]